MDCKDPERVILHIIVVGFHHQRGSEVMNFKIARSLGDLEGTCCTLEATSFIYLFYTC